MPLNKLSFFLLNKRNKAIYGGLQETTATVLSAALAARNSGATTSISSAASSSGEQISLSTVVPSSSVDKHVQSKETKLVVTSELIEEKKGLECGAEVTIYSSHCRIDLFFLTTALARYS